MAIPCMVACDDEDGLVGADGPSVGETDSIEWEDMGPGMVSDGVKISMPAAMVGDIPQQLRTALSERLDRGYGESLSPDLGIVFVEGGELENHTAELTQLYEAGGIIAVVCPDDERLDDWCDANGIFCAGDNDNSTDAHLLYAFCNTGYHYFLDDMPEDPETGAPVELTQEEYGGLLNSFVAWVNMDKSADNVVRLTTTVSRRSSNSTTVEDVTRIAQGLYISHTFNISLNVRVGKLALSKPDSLKRNGTIDVSYSVYPLYVFPDGQNSGGDYYLVIGGFTVHNDKMYKGKYTHKHGGFTNHIGGFYLTKFDYKVELQERQKDSYVNVGAFAPNGSPVPETTVSSTSYTSGFNWGLSGSINAGMKGKDLEVSGTFGGNVGWSSSESTTKVDVETHENSTSNAPHWAFIINNLPHTSGGVKHLDIPAIAKSNLSINTSWVWYLPNNSVGTVGPERVAKFTVAPTYGAYHYYTAGTPTFKAETWNAKVDSAASFTLPAIDRIPRGTLCFNNQNGEYKYMTNIKIWKAPSETSNVADVIKEAPYLSDDGTYGVEREANFVLPEGIYAVSIDVGDNIDSLQTYQPDRFFAVKRANETMVYPEFVK